ncbi:MAG: Do family serine endopeptidase, partial [Kiritimatiellia bacterium]
ILTNNHIVGDADKITVKLHDGREFEAENIGSDPQSEVAVIKIKGDNLPFLEPGDSEALEIGEWAIAIGNPFGLSETLTVGVISAKGRNNLGLTDYEDFIQTDAAINPGNSGGPLLNVDGKVIGMSTAIFSQTGGSLGIGFAIPINMAMAIKDQLVAGGKVTRGFLGILMQDLTPDIALSMGLKQSARGVIVVEVMRGSVAGKAGLKQGDVIVALDGKLAQNANILRNQVAMLTPGKSVKMKIIRNGAEMDLTVVVGSQSETADASTPSPASEQIGLSIGNLDQALGEQLGVKAPGGVVVSAVRPDSPAHRAGIAPGNVICNINRRPVGSVEDYNTALAAAEETGLALILVRDREGARFLTIRLK